MIQEGIANFPVCVLQSRRTSLAAAAAATRSDFVTLRLVGVVVRGRTVVFGLENQNPLEDLQKMQSNLLCTIYKNVLPLCRIVSHPYSL
jgi:hypothetical protein